MLSKYQKMWITPHILKKVSIIVFDYFLLSKIISIIVFSYFLWQFNKITMTYIILPNQIVDHSSCRYCLSNDNNGYNTTI